MMCVWNPLLAILPQRLKKQVEEIGRNTMQELRLRINSPPEMICAAGSHWLAGNVTRDELHGIVNAASRYSPWAAATVRQGYLTAAGGHRIGMCGEAVCKNGKVELIRDLTSLCIRVARDYPGIAGSTVYLEGSILILGAPGWGKTTFLRDLVRQIAQRETTTVIDQREELFPDGFERGARMDVLTGCGKAEGVLMALRTMGPSNIAMDEITAEEDTKAILQAANCGVRLIATAHGRSIHDLRKRTAYQQLLENEIFDHLILLKPDKSYHVERVRG